MRPQSSEGGNAMSATPNWYDRLADEEKVRRMMLAGYTFEEATANVEALKRGEPKPFTITFVRQKTAADAS